MTTTDLMNAMLDDASNAPPTDTDTTPDAPPPPQLLGDLVAPDRTPVRIVYGFSPYTQHQREEITRGAGSRHNGGTVLGRSAAIHGKAATFDAAIKDLARLDAEDGERQDITGVDLSRARLRHNGRLYLQTPVGEFPLRQHALKQLCSSIGAPAWYVETLPTRTAVKALAWGLRTKPIEGGRRLRLANGEVRAIVTDRYRICDNAQLMGMTREALKQSKLLKDAQVEQMYLGARMGVMASIGKRLDEGDPMTGKGSRVGIGIGNGERGNGSKKGSLTVYVPWCTNGCSINIGRFGFRSTHLAKMEEGEFIEVLCALLEEVPNLTGLTERAAREAFNLSVLQERIDSLGVSRAQARAVTREVLAEALGLYPTVDTIDASKIEEARLLEIELHKARTEDEKLEAARGVYDALGVVDTDTAFNTWQLCQGVTAVGRDELDETREQFEELGGQILAEFIEA